VGHKDNDVPARFPEQGCVLQQIAT